MFDQTFPIRVISNCIPPKSHAVFPVLALTIAGADYEPKSRTATHVAALS